MVIISWLKFNFNQCLANIFYQKGMAIHRRKLLVEYFSTLLDGINEKIILQGVHTSLTQWSLEVRDHLLYQDLAIIFLNLVEIFGYCIVTQIDTKEHLHLFIQLFSYPDLNWRVILHIPYNPFLMRLIAYMGPSSFSSKKIS